MGMFDDLIPRPTPDKPKGMFDDLIEEGQKRARLKAAQATSGNSQFGIFADLVPEYKPAPGEKPRISFADLIPANQRNPADLPEHSAVKTYWDPAKKAYVDSTGQVQAKLGDKSPWELFKAEKLHSAETFTGGVQKGFGDKDIADVMLGESLPAHLVQGLKRPANVSLDVDEQGGLIGTDTSPPSAAQPKDKTDPGIIADLKALGVTAKEHPGLVIGSLVKSVVADPELLLPWLWEAIPEATAAKVAQAAKAMGASVNIAKAAEVGGRVAGRMAIGGTVGGSVEAGQQFAEGRLDPSRIGTAAAEGAVFSVPGRMVGKGKAAPRTAEPHQELMTPEEAAKVAAVPDERLTPIDTSREELARATKEDPITPEMIADVSKEPIRPPTESRDRLVRAIKQAAAGGAIGAAVGYGVAGEDSKLTGVEMGTLLGAGLPLLKARRYLGPDISELVNARNGQVRTVMRHAYQFQHQIEKAVPLKTDREHLATMVDKGVEPATGTPEHDAYRNLKQFFGDMGQLAKDAGVVNSLRENYISHIVEGDPAQKATLLQRIFGSDKTSGTGRGGSAFGKERKYDTFEELQQAIEDSGLRLKTKDASEIAGIYANAVYKSIADKRLLAALKETKLPDGTGLVVPADKAPSHYARPGGALTGNAVHPDIAPDLEFVFTNRQPNALFRKLSAITSVAKRLTISFSLFHAKSLAEGFAIASNGSMRERVTPITAAKAALKIYREGGNNDSLDHLIKNGLIVGTPEDVAGREVGTALTRLSDVLNEKLPLRGLGVGALAKGLAAIDRGVEHFTFGFLQTGMKINVALSEFERMLSRGVDRDRAARLSASFANDVFGSLDYYRVATDTDSHIMRRLGTASLNQNARKVLQLVLFAPDWTLATFRTMAKALPGGARDAEAMQAHRRYMVKAAIYYFTVANAANYALSGHSIFSNKNPTRLELSDGRTMQFAKHETEPLEWLRDPLDTALNKGAFIPATARQIYRSHVMAAAYKKPPPTPAEDALTAAHQLMPISLQQFVQNGISSESLWGAVGFPIYGKSKDEAKQHRATAKEKKIQESYQ